MAKNTFKIFILLIFFTVKGFTSFSQGNTPCNANAFCSSTSYNFPNNTGSQSAQVTYPNMHKGCFYDAKNPIWYYMEVDQSGTINMTIKQTKLPNGAGATLDVDFILWGPFPSLNQTSCDAITNGTAYPIQSSYSANATENLSIGGNGGYGNCSDGPGQSTTAPAQAGDVYIILITNYSNQSGYISFSQTGGSGSASCNIIQQCGIQSITGNATCNTGSSNFNYTGAVTFSNAPTTGTLTISSSCGGTSAVLNPPFTSPMNFTINNIPGGTGSCILTAKFSADNNCSKTLNITKPVCCNMATPTVVITPQSCVADGGGKLSNYSASNTYTFTPTGPTVGVNGVINGMIAGTSYTVVAAAGNCISSASSSFLVQPKYVTTITATPSDMCVGGADQTLTATPTGGVWSTNNTSLATISNAGIVKAVAAGTVLISYTANGCVDSKTINVAPAPFASIAYSGIYCNSDTTLYAPTFSGDLGGKYTVSAGLIIDSITGSINPLKSTAGTYTVTYTIAPSGSCPLFQTTANVQILPTPKGEIKGTTEVCLDAKSPVLKLYGSNGTAPYIFTYSLNGGNSISVLSVGDSASIVVPTNKSGTFVYVLKATTDGSILACSNPTNDTVVVIVNPLPEASFIPTPGFITSYDNKVVFTNTSKYANSYIWNFGDNSASNTLTSPEHIFSPENQGGYIVTLTAINNLGCTDTARVTIRMTEDIVFFVPNSFTPDGDEFNNIFKPVFASGYDGQMYEMMIFDRWGELIFETHDVNFGWDGTYLSGGGKMCPTGAYTWVITIKKSTVDERITKTGHVTLLR